MGLSVCSYCGGPCGEAARYEGPSCEGAAYCSRKCRAWAQRPLDYQSPPPSPRVPGSRREANRWLRYYQPRKRWQPYDKFEKVTVPGKRVQVPETPEAQHKAELLIERGCCAYRNARGLIRDIGVPAKTKHRGKVYAAHPSLPKLARDSYDRRKLLRAVKGALGESGLWTRGA